ncbi:MAG: alpha/beta hydrolase [Bacteroidota bacterium]
MTRKLLAGYVLLFLFGIGQVQAQGTFRYADLGDFDLESGLVIQNCRIGYRTFGKLNKDLSNVILFPTWFAGTSQDVVGYVGGANKMLDSLKYYIIAVDALGNGVSSSPSNSKQQAGAAFPKFSIRDMVNSQYLLLTRKLKINRLEAVIGISMGGMQTFQWMISHPEFMFKAIPIVGSPRLTSQDLLLCQTQLQVIETNQNCESNEPALMKSLAYIHALALTTPEYRVRMTKTEDYKKYLADQEKGVMTKKPLDWACQLRAIVEHDIYEDPGKTVEQIAQTITTRYVLIVSAIQDHMVNPASARELATLLQAETLELTGDCGHLAPSCELPRLVEAVQRVLKK